MNDAILETGEKITGTDSNDTLSGGEGNDTIRGGNGDDSLSGNGGNDRIFASHGDDQVFGGDGDDKLWGDNGNDTLFGDDGDDTIRDGMGADILDGGDGDDRIISRSDAGEPDIAQETDESKVYPDQPFLDADDTLIGGTGADTFRFELLLNAKDEIVEKHADPITGKVDWKKVAHENDNVHDHWVDGIGNDTIEDFNKEEGDKIEIVGHTVKVSEIEYVDLNDDGIIDKSIIHLISDQGANGGAHNQDELGRITVYGDQVEESDLKVNAGVFYGAFKSIYNTVGTDEDNLISGTDSKDTIDGGDGNDSLSGEGGNDKIFAGDGDDLVLGGDGKDKIWGNTGNDTVSGGDGNDKIWGGDGDDSLSGDAGKDKIWGDVGNDSISGGDGNDTIRGGDGDDALSGDAGKDKIWGDVGNDSISGGDGNDKIWGGDGDDSLSGDAGKDKIWGDVGNDSISGGDEDDKLWGGDGDDVLEGGSGNDTIRGGMGADILDGGDEDDRLISRSDAGEPDIDQETDESKVYPDQPFLDADDTLIGGIGADTFRFELLLNAKDEIVEKHADPITGEVNWKKVAHENDNVHDHWVDGIGNDTIEDFNKSEGDKITIAGHTVEVREIEYVHLDEDEILESIIHLISNQGANGGAHNQDELGSITVYGDLVEASDLSVNAGVFFGAFNSINDLA